MPAGDPIINDKQIYVPPSRKVTFPDADMAVAVNDYVITVSQVKTINVGDLSYRGVLLIIGGFEANIGNVGGMYLIYGTSGVTPISAFPSNHLLVTYNSTSGLISITSDTSNTITVRATVQY